MGKMITNNVAYELIEIQGKLQPKLRIITKNGIALELTPYGVATLARDLAIWAKEQCPDTAEFIKCNL